MSILNYPILKYTNVIFAKLVGLEKKKKVLRKIHTGERTGNIFTGRKWKIIASWQNCS